MKQNLTNHFGILIDASGSVAKYKSIIIKLVDQQVKAFAKTSKEMDQETRISIYTFQGNGFQGVKNVVFDMDVMRFDTLDGKFDPDGGTPLRDGIIQMLRDLKTISQLYTDHAFLINIITDGEENTSISSHTDLVYAIKAVPENYTLSISVPNQTGVYYAKQLGFDKNNISVWDTTSEKGYEELSTSTVQAVKNYMTLRSTGIRKSSNFFQVDTKNVTQTDVRKAATVLKPEEFTKLYVPASLPPKTMISTFVESHSIPYRIGKSYYELVKPEKIQPQKEIILADRRTGILYHGKYVRQLLNLPDYEVKVTPGDFGDWQIFVQSTAINRHLVPGTFLMVMK